MSTKIEERTVSSITMRDAAVIFREGQFWRVRSMDNLHLLARGEEQGEVHWEMDRFTRFGSLEGAIKAWEVAARTHGEKVWKGA